MFVLPTEAAYWRSFSLIRRSFASISHLIMSMSFHNDWWNISWIEQAQYHETIVVAWNAISTPNFILEEHLFLCVEMKV